MLVVIGPSFSPFLSWKSLRRVRVLAYACDCVCYLFVTIGRIQREKGGER
jgi:hypothetical protein